MQNLLCCPLLIRLRAGGVILFELRLLGADKTVESQEYFSILEAIYGFEERLGKQAQIRYSDTHRNGDHIWYISAMDKFKSHYPDWHYTYDIEQILDDICEQGHFK